MAHPSRGINSERHPFSKIGNQQNFKRILCKNLTVSNFLYWGCRVSYALICTFFQPKPEYVTPNSHVIQSNVNWDIFVRNYTGYHDHILTACHYDNEMRRPCAAHLEMYRRPVGVCSQLLATVLSKLSRSGRAGLYPLDYKSFQLVQLLQTR